MVRGVLTAMAVVVLGAASFAWAGPADLAPHRAIYSMGLATTKPGSGIAAASGTMSYQFEDSCDGWVVENRIAVNYAYTEGGQALSATDFITWESKDGLHYRFRMRNSRDGLVTEEVEGHADLKGKGQGGVAKFTRPESFSMPLPKGTLFPTDHTLRLIDAAQGGNRTFWKVVFDGSGLDGPYEVNALIGKQSQTLPSTLVSPLLGSPYWPMHLAFFPLSSPEEVPNFEMRLAYHPNGVAQEIVQTFKSFSLRGKLETVESLPRRGC